jgi:hypothetical protein
MGPFHWLSGAQEPNREQAYTTNRLLRYQRKVSMSTSKSQWSHALDVKAAIDARFEPP